MRELLLAMESERDEAPNSMCRFDPSFVLDSRDRFAYGLCSRSVSGEQFFASSG